MLGYSREEVLGRAFIDVLEPDEWPRIAAEVARFAGGQAVRSEWRFRRKDGSVFVGEVSGRQLPDGRLQGVLRDVTDRKRAETLIECQKRSLELVVTGEPLEGVGGVLDCLARSIESQLQGALVAIHLLEADGYHFGYVAAPSLPAKYARATKGMDARLELGCCSSAVMSHTPTIVRDFAAETRWPAFTAGVVSLGLRGCFTTPILSPDNKVLGTFAIYYREPRDPSPDDRQLVDVVTRTVALAIARKQAEESARKRSEQIRRLAEVLPRINAATDVPAIMGVLTEEARSLIESHQSVASMTTGPDWGQAINAVSLSEKYAEWRAYDTKPDGSGIYALVCRLNKPMRMTQAELEAHPAWKGFGKEAGKHPPMLGWLAAPLVGRDGRNMGLIQLSDKCEGEFTEDDEYVLVQLAQMASVAVENTSLVQDLRNADRRKDELLATLAHELRNPLAPLRNGLQIMRLASHSRESVEQARTMMERQLGQMTRLIDDLMDVSRINLGQGRTPQGARRISEAHSAGT